MRVEINGKEMDVDEGCTIATLLDRLYIKKERVAVELNLDIVQKGNLSDTILKEGDKIEIVSFVGGG